MGQRLGFDSKMNCTIIFSKSNECCCCNTNTVSVTCLWQVRFDGQRGNAYRGHIGNKELGVATKFLPEVRCKLS